MPCLIQLFFEKFQRETRNSIEINNLIRQGIKQPYKVNLTHNKNHNKNIP